MQRPLRSRTVRPAAGTASVSLWHAAARALRLAGGPCVEPRLAGVARSDDVALSRVDAAARRRGAAHAGGGVDAADSCDAARIRARAGAALRQGRVAQPDQLVQGARSRR